MRIRLTDLAASTDYALQVRSKNGTAVSEWSRIFNITTDTDSVAPNVPGGVGGSMTGTSFNISWNAVTTSTDSTPAYDLVGYEVLVASSGTGTTGIYSTTNLNFQFTIEMNRELFTTPRANIILSVRAVDLAGNTSSYSSTVDQTNAAPSAPTNLVVDELVDSIGLKWDPNTSDADLVGYEVWLSTTGSGGSYSKIWAGAATAMVHSTINYATDHWYRVYSVDIFGTLSTALQSGAAARPGSTFTVDTTPPAVPTGLAATLTTAADLVTYANVSWNAVSDPDNDLAGYRIGYRPNGATDWEYTDADAEQTTARVYNLTPYVEYNFRIRSYDFMANFSNWSSTVTTTTAATNTAPSAPTGVAISGGMRTATVTWNENSEADLKDYEIQLDTSNAFNTGNLQTVKTDGTVISFLDLTDSTTYYTRVRAYDNLGLNSSWSSPIVSDSVGTITADLSDGNPPSSSPTPTVRGGVGFLWVEWTPVSNADITTYEVHMSTSSGFTPSGSTLIGEVSGSAFVIKKTAAGGSLSYGTTYYVKTVAFDADGSASASSQGSGTMTQATTSDIAVNTITAASGILADLSVGEAKIINLAVTEAKIGSLAVTEGKIGNLAVTNAKIGLLAVDTAQIAALAVTDAKINDLAANKITAGTGIINNLTVKSTLTMGDGTTNGIIQSNNYVASTSGYKLDQTGLEINNGTIKAGTLQIQTSANQVPTKYASFEFASTNYSLGALNTANTFITSSPKYQTQCLQTVITATASQKYTLFATSLTDYNTYVDGTPIIMSVWVKNTGGTNVQFKLNVRGDNTTYYAGAQETINSGTGWTRYYATMNLASNVTAVMPYIEFFNTNGGTVCFDGFMIEKKIGALSTPSIWTQPGITTADGGIIRTGSIISNNTIDVSGTALPAWSINTSGNAQFGDALVRGKLVVGSSSEAPVNIAPNSGDFESNVTGYSVYTVGGTGTSITRTTTGGEVIAGTGSAKVTAAAGSKTSLGIQFDLPTTAPEGTRLTVNGLAKANATGGEFAIAFINSSASVIGTYSTVTTPTADVVYSHNATFTIPEDEDVDTIAIYIGGTTSATTFIADTITVSTSENINYSYVSSHDYEFGSKGWRINGDGSVEFNNGTFRGQLGAGTVTADTLASELVISTAFKTASTGRRVEYSADGITLYDTDNSLLVNMPTDSDVAASFYGDLVTSSLYIDDYVTIGGTHNEISRAAELTIQAGTVAPTAAPTVTIGWDQIDYGYDPTWNPYKHGLAYSSVDGYFMYIQNIWGTNCNINYHDDSTGASIWTTTKMQDVWVGYGGLTVLGTEIFVLGQNIDGNWIIEVRNATTKAWVRTMSLAAYGYTPYPYRPAIGNNGTDLILGYATGEGYMKFRVINKTTLATTAQYLSNFAVGSKPHITSVGYDASTIFGGARFWFTREGDTEVHVQSGTTGNTYSAANSHNFFSPDTIRGLVYANLGSGSFFYTRSEAGKITTHTGVNWTGDNTEYSTWHAGITWYDSNSTGSTHETQVGPLRTFTMKKRAGLTITTPPLPIRPSPTTDDDVVASGLYMARNASTPTNAQLERQYYLPDGDTVTYLHRSGGTITNLPNPDVNATNAPPTSNEFSSIIGAPGMIRSAGNEFYVTGTGAGEWGPIEITSAGALVMNAGFTASDLRPVSSGDVGSTQNTSSSTAVVYTTGPKIDFVAPPSGQVQLSADAAIRSVTNNNKFQVNVRVREGTSTSSGTIMFDEEFIATRYPQYCRYGAVSVADGLTAGTTYNAHLTITSVGGTSCDISGARLVVEPTV